MALQLFDAYGRIIEKPPTKPLTELIGGAVRIRDQWSTYPSVRLTPDKLATIFKEADAGELVRQAELFEEMEEKDPILGSVMHTRKLAVQGLEPEILPASDSADDKKIADHVKKNFDDLDLDDVVLDLLDAIGKGFASVWIQWALDNRLAWVTGFEWVHQKRWTFVNFNANWNAPLPKLPRLLTDAQPLLGEETEPFTFIFHRYRARTGFTQRAGLFRSIAYYYLFKNYDIKDWIIFLEKFGQPLRLGKFTPGASDDDKKVLKEALVNLGTDAAALISDTTMLEILEAKAAQVSGDLYKTAAEYFDKTYEIAILGQTATTQGTPGKLGNEQAQAEVRSDLRKADARALAKCLRQQLVWPMVGFNFGWDRPLPKIRFPFEEPEDLVSLSETHKNLVDMGTPIPLSFVRKKYGIPEPQAGEGVLKPPAQPQFPSPLAAAMLDKKKVPIGRRLVKISD